MLRLREHLESIFGPEIRAHRIVFRMKRGLKHAAFTTDSGSHFIISVRAELRTDLAVEAAGLCVARVVLGHDFKRLGYRQEHLNREEWAAGVRWLGRRLIPDALMARYRRKRWDRYDLAEQAGTTDHLTVYRLADWAAQKGQIVSFPRIVRDAAEVIADSQEAEAWCSIPGDSQELGSKISDFFYL